MALASQTGAWATIAVTGSSGLKDECAYQYIGTRWIEWAGAGKNEGRRERGALGERRRFRWGRCWVAGGPVCLCLCFGSNQVIEDACRA